MKRTNMLIISTIFLCGVLFFTTPARNAVNAQGNGRTSAIPAYYDAKLFTIFFVEFSSKAEETLIAHNSGINFIYQYDPGVNGQPFISVIDAVPGDGMNPIWEEVQLVFNTIPPQQFYSDNDVLAAATAGQISLVFTGEVYKCPIVGKKTK